MSVLEEKKKPSLYSIAFFSVLMAMLGALSSFLLLASISPKPYKSVADYERAFEENPRKRLLDAHYFTGSKSSSSGWMQKRDSLLTSNDTTIMLSDSEINAWISNRFQKPKVSFFNEEKSNVFFALGLPNFFIDPTEGIHFSILLETVVFGKKIDSLLIGKGYFSEGDASEFNLSELSLNEARIPFSKSLLDDLLTTLLESFYQNNELVILKEAWEKVDSVELVENGIRLNLD